MSTRTLASIQRDLEIVLESFQAIESLAQNATYDGATQDVSRALVPTNLLMENLIGQIRDSYVEPKKVDHINVHVINSAKTNRSQLTGCEPQL